MPDGLILSFSKPARFCEVGPSKLANKPLFITKSVYLSSGLTALQLDFALLIKMNQATIQHIEHLVDHYLSDGSGRDRVVFHCKVNIADIIDDHVLGDVVYHDMLIEGGSYYEFTNINKFVCENNADLKYIPTPLQHESSSDVSALSLSNHTSTELAVESDAFGEWEFECFLTQINKEECGQFLFEAFGTKDNIDFLSYPEKLHGFVEEAFETYLIFEDMLNKTMQRYNFY